MTKINKSKLAITVISNVLLISLFIALFFFTYGGYIEKKVVKSQMKFLADDISNYIKLSGKITTGYASNYLNNLELPDLEEADYAAAEANKKTVKKAIMANIGFCICACIVMALIYFKSKKDFKLKEIVIQNLILLVFIGFTEFCFLTYFGANYVSINPSAVKEAIITNLEELDSGDDHAVRSH